jgi:hypothetical protein
MNRLKRGPDLGDSDKVTKTVDGEIGVFFVSVDKKSTKGMKPKQRLRSASFRELSLRLVSKLSYRDTTDVLNRALHRDECNSVKTSTMEDWVESFGESLSEGYTSRAEEILESYHIDKQNGIISEGASLPPSVLNPELPAVIGETQARHLITEYNRGRDRMTKLKYDELASGIEDGTGMCCYISVDDIGVRFQKPERKGKCKKNRSFIENTVIHIQAEGKQYTLTAIGLDKAFKLLVAFLLENKLMEDHRLIFFSDGATCIRDGIGKYFGFRQYTIILDWLHLEKKCNEFLSMGIKGSKDEKQRIKKEVASILWTGRHQNAINYLESLKKSQVRNSVKIEELKDYIRRKSPNLTCYALRHELKLRISSNRVEKANDLVVATRQKHNGMSWSRNGSGALAIITATMINGEMEGWMTKRRICYRMAS